MQHTALNNIGQVVGNFIEFQSPTGIEVGCNTGDQVTVNFLAELTYLFQSPPGIGVGCNSPETARTASILSFLFQSSPGIGARCNTSPRCSSFLMATCFSPLRGLGAVAPQAQPQWSTAARLHVSVPSGDWERSQQE